MFKYILFLQLCSAVDNVCFEEIKFPKLFDSHYECGLAGYKSSTSIFETANKDTVNSKKLFVRFYCIKNEML